MPMGSVSVSLEGRFKSVDTIEKNKCSLSKCHASWSWKLKINARNILISFLKFSFGLDALKPNVMDF